MTFTSLFQSYAVVVSMIVILLLAILPRDKDGNIQEPPKIYTDEADKRAGRMALSILVLLIATVAVALNIK